MSSLWHLTTAPKAGDFTPLEEHQQQTPSTFFGAKPVLYAHHVGLTIAASKAKLQSDDAFANFSSEPEGTSDDEVLVPNVAAWVNAENLILFQDTPQPTGVVIPYPSIALHGITKKNGVEALLMNLSLNDAETVNADEDIDVLEIVLLPPSSAADAPHTSSIQEIFAAMNTCADLHPDPEDDEDGAPDLTAPGATGWITADNMDEYVDEDGNFKGAMVIGDEELGPGAGTVRPRDGDEEEQEANGVNGHEDKYQRTG